MKIERRMNQSDENRSIFIRGADSTNHLGSPYAILILAASQAAFRVSRQLATPL